MAVYLPTAAVGNGKILATLGGAGEMMTFFYPRLDFAQNVRESLPALYVGDPGHGVFHWTFDAAFRRRQFYLGDTGILRTELELATPPLVIELEDFCPPEATALVRRVRVRNVGDAHLRGAYFHYCYLALGEVQGKQAVRWDATQGHLLQYFRDIVFSVGGTPPDMWRCGRSLDQNSPASAKSDMYDGHLNGQPEDIGQVDFALGYRLDLAPRAERVIDQFFCGEMNSKRSSRHQRELRERGFAALRQDTEQDDAAWLARAPRLNVSAPYQRAYARALLSIRQLVDRRTHGMLAAPEFDPNYERSGGYGYCWPRDASAVVDTLHAAGYPEYLDRMADWYAEHQLSDGVWAQRYWLDGRLAASWALREDFLQLDQCGAAILTLGHALAEAPEAPRHAKLLHALRQGVQAIVSRVEDNWNLQACDLWETYCGTFVYTNAALACALAAAGEVEAREGDPARAALLAQYAAELRQRTLDLYTGEYFPRGRRADGHVDLSVDTATLGLVTPFPLVDLSDPQQRAQVDGNLATIVRRLGQGLGSTWGLRRFEGDGYLNGVIGCVNTLWAAQVSLKLARAEQREDPERSAQHRRWAVDWLDFCLAHATPTGLLPELIGLYPDAAYWAAPHAWASALFMDCMHELSALDAG
ncbi:MAG TPA: glycoside hydrolase family 15 protein [Armatimonadota bacterium]|jgi:oligosaccharide amylase